MPGSDVIRLAKEYKAALQREELAQMTDMAYHWRYIVMSLERRIAEFVKISEGMTFGQMQRSSRYEQLLAQVRQEIVPYRDYVEGAVRGRRLELGMRGVQESAELIKAYGVRASFSVLDRRAVENIVQNMPLRTLLKGISTTAIQEMSAKLATANALGLNPVVTARWMKEGIRGGFQRSLVIARDQQLKAYRESSRQNYAKSGVVISYKRLAAKQTRTCLACLIDDGHEYKLESEFNEHVCGRCSIVPVVEGFKPANWQLGQDWLEGQSEATQLGIMGQGRFNAWKQGKSLEGMVTSHYSKVWGESIAIRNVV